MRLRIVRNNDLQRTISMRFLGPSLISLAVAGLATFPAFADELASDVNDPNIIVVTGTSDGYAASNSVTATKTDTPLLDVPQTVNVITREQLDDQGHHSLADVLRYVPGVTVGQGEGNRDQITLRGQNTTADFFVDGVRDDVQYFRGLYNLDRVEILKGPYALIFGRGGGGGIVNRVQKSPLLEDAFVGGRASINSFGAYDFSADINQPLSDTIAVRVNANYENLDNHRDFYSGERYAINPYIAAKLGEDWNVGLSYEYVSDDRVLDRGIPSIASRPLTGFRDQFFGVPGVNRTTLEAHIAKLRLDGDVTDTLKFSSTLLYGDYDKLYDNVFANGSVNAVTNVVALSGYSDPTTRQNFIAQANLIWDVQTGGIEHKILLGAEYGDQKSANQRRNAVLTPGNIDLDASVFPTVTFAPVSRDTVSDVEFFSTYIQDQISLGGHFDIIAGLRYDRFDINGTDLAATPDRPFARRDTKVSPRLGLIYKPEESVSIYTSYSQSFKPRSGDQFLTLSASDEDLAPEKFTNYELGAKWDIRPNFNVTAAIFQLDRTNATTPDPANVTQTIVVGSTRVKGVELAATGRIMPAWQVSAGYTFQNAYLRGNDDVRLAQVPKHQVSLWNRYDVTEKLGAGLGIIRQSSQFAANQIPGVVVPATRLPGFTRVDAALFYTVNEQLKVQLNVENLFDETYFSDAHNNNNISTGAPINGRLSVQVKF
jgi:catecholate siderophore receptor